MSMRDWLDEGHLAWFVLDVVAAIDTSAFHARYRLDGPGRPAYDPEMMLGLLFYAYGMGMRSSRRIERACRTDAAFRVLSGGVTPDHATIARFVVDHEQAIENSFVEVLRLCAAAGLVTVSAVAIDGTKIGSDASLQANRGRDAITSELARLRAKAVEIVAEAKATDAAENSSELFSFDELPGELASGNNREARLRRALAIIDAEDDNLRRAAADYAERARTAASEGCQVHGRRRNDPHADLARSEIEVRLLEARVETVTAERAAKRAAAETEAAAKGRKLRGSAPRPGPTKRAQRQLEQAKARVEKARTAIKQTPSSERVANITDPDSRILKSAAGWVQGYNSQAAVNENQIVLAGKVSQDANDVGLYQPMIQATQDTLTGLRVLTPINVVLADAGYWSETNATAPGPPRLIATVKDWKQRRAAREMGVTTGPPPPDASQIETMEHRLRTPEGAAAYAQRSHTVEPVFGDHKENNGWRRFRRRGLPAANSEWALMNLTHNLGKLFDYHTANPGHALS
jgi:transposase